MIELKNVEIMTTKLERMWCDKCKREITPQELTQGNYATMKFTGGYGSEYPEDMETVETELCEGCLQELIGQFARSSKF